MTKTQYRAALKKLGLTVVGAAPYFGCGRRAVQNYAGGRPIPPLLQKVIGLLLRGKITLEDLK